MLICVRAHVLLQSIAEHHDASFCPPLLAITSSRRSFPPKRTALVGAFSKRSHPEGSALGVCSANKQCAALSSATRQLNVVHNLTRDQC